MSHPNYTCPKGHAATLENGRTPVCVPCKLIATHFNAGTGEVFNWMSMVKHWATCERLQDDLDAAFDHQYFDGGW